MACKTCKYFKKIRNVHFGECSNDDFFQYAEDREDLTGLGNNTLVIMGQGEPIVGTEYSCTHFVSRKDSDNKDLTATQDFKDVGGFKPAAQQKRMGNGRLAARRR